MANTIPLPATLVKRLVKLTPLTHGEGDSNLDAIVAYMTMLRSLFGVALNADGTLNVDSVDTINLKNRSVTENKLGSASVFPPKEDSGVTNAMVITLDPAITAYEIGQVFGVFVANTNTGPVTLRCGTALAALPVKKKGNLDLEAGDLLVNSFAVFAYRDGVFQLLGSSLSSQSSSSAGGFSGFQVYAPAEAAIPPDAAVAASGTVVSTGVNVSDGDTVTIGATVYRFKTVMALAYDVQIGVDAATSLANLKAAINASGTPGVEYFAGTLIHPSVTGGTITSTTLLVTANATGLGGNAIATTDTAATLSWNYGTLTGGVTDTFATFIHGLSATPDVVATLICVTADMTFAVGQEVPLQCFVDGSGEPAFIISANSSVIIIDRNTATISVPAIGAITESNWRLKVRGEIKTNTAGEMFPAASMAVHYPQGAFAYGSDLFVVSWGVLNKSQFMRVSLANGGVLRLSNPDSGPDPGACNFACFARADLTNDAVFTSSTGIYRLQLLQVPVWKPIQLSSVASAWQSWKPVQLLESGGSVVKVYIAPAGYSASASVTICPLKEVTMSSGVAVDVGGGAVDWSSTTIKEPDGLTAGNSEFRAYHPNAANNKILMLQYNRLKKRIYLVTNEVALIHIFELINTSGYTDPASIVEWWRDATRYQKLKYVKSVVIGGDGAPFGDVSRESISIDFDLVTGTERAIVFNRVGNTITSGSVTRAPWRE